MLHLETDRLFFRQWQNEDFLVFRDFFSNPETSKYVGGEKSPEEAWRLMATYIGHYHLMGYSYTAVVEKDSNEIIGTVGLWNSAPWPEPELGYWLVPAFQGQGYGSEAGKAVLQFARLQLKLPSLVSYIDARNQPSISLAERLGAQYNSDIQLLQFGQHRVYRYW